MPSKPKTLSQLADNFVGKFGSAPGSREWDFMCHAFKRGYTAAQRRNSKRRVMAVLDAVFAEGGYKLTVRSYNKILTGLGHRLSNPK